MQSLENIKAEAVVAIEAASDIAALEELRVSYLGKKGALTGLLKNLGQLSAEERPKAGAEINAVKQQLNEQLKRAKPLYRALHLPRSSPKRQSMLPCQDVALRRARCIQLRAPFSAWKPSFPQWGLRLSKDPKLRMTTTILKRSIFPRIIRLAPCTIRFTSTTHMYFARTSGVQVRTMEAQQPPSRDLSRPGLSL